MDETTTAASIVATLEAAVAGVTAAQAELDRAQRIAEDRMRPHQDQINDLLGRFLPVMRFLEFGSPDATEQATDLMFTEDGLRMYWDTADGVQGPRDATWSELLEVEAGIYPELVPLRSVA